MPRVQRRKVLRLKKHAAGRQFLGDAAQQSGGEGDVIPTRDKSVDLLGCNAALLEQLVKLVREFDEWDASVG